MKILFVLITVLLTACGSSGSKEQPIEVLAEPSSAIAFTNPIMLAIGDSLCDPTEGKGWPLLIEGYSVDNQCIGGAGVYRSFRDAVPVYEYTPQYSDITVIALGMNDAIMGVDADSFELAYLVLYDSVTNPVCLLPPLSENPAIQVLMTEYHRRILSFCEVAVHSAPSDAMDGIHYTSDSDIINADIVTHRTQS